MPMESMVSSMNRLSLFAIFLFGGLCCQAQTSSTITISTVPSGAEFSVDGQVYNSSVTLVWPAGSTHTLVFITDPPAPGQTTSTGVQTSQDGSTIYSFSGWTDNAGLLQPTSAPVQTITANPAITTLTANLTVAYRVLLNYFNANGSNGGSPPPTCGAPGAIPSGFFAPGVVNVAGTCYWSSATLYLPANSSVILNAFPYPGFDFLGWVMNGAPVNQYLASLTLSGPITLTPQFTPGKLVHFVTSPPGLNVMVDHTSVPTRTDVSNVGGPCPANEEEPIPQQLGFPQVCFGDFYFAPGSTHVIGGVSPQLDATGNYWVFSSWSNGTGDNAIYTTDNNTGTPDTLTGTYVPGVTVSFATTPSSAGLQLTIDGQKNWPSYNFIWGTGTTHTFSAAASQYGSDGRDYTFQNWSNGGAPSQSLTVGQSTVVGGMRMTASYNELSRVVVQSSPPGQTVQIDGTSCTTPCNVDRQNGVQVNVSAQTQIPMGTGSRLDFSSWSDGGASTHAITVTQNYTTLTVNYNTSYQLTASSNPANGVSFQFSPASSDMFYAQNTQVTITAAMNPGFKFIKWGGALSGSFPSGVVTMSAPLSVVAQLGTVPYIAPAGVLNGAGVTPSTAVAPGSVISIFGQGLAPSVQVGPVNPLSQTLAGVSVTVNNLILPLLFVSPTQINAQVPSELTDGNYTLLIQNTGQPAVSANFTVARNAPGLFFQTLNSQPYVVAMHADGSAVTPDSPAIAGETISMLGTGFGPYNSALPDGFFPPTPAPVLEDSVSISLGGQNPAPTWVGAASGYTGLTSTVFTVPTGLPSGAPVPLTVTINGIESNTVMLPVQ